MCAYPGASCTLQGPDLGADALDRLLAYAQVCLVSLPLAYGLGLYHTIYPALCTAPFLSLIFQSPVGPVSVICAKFLHPPWRKNACGACLMPVHHLPPNCPMQGRYLGLHFAWSKADEADTRCQPLPQGLPPSLTAQPELLLLPWLALYAPLHGLQQELPASRVLGSRGSWGAVRQGPGLCATPACLPDVLALSKVGKGGTNRQAMHAYVRFTIKGGIILGRLHKLVMCV